MTPRTPFAISALVAVTVLAGCGRPAPDASATPGPTASPVASTASTTTGTERPSACRPANHRGVITPDEPSAGHLHYRVTLTAPPGYEPCTLAGAPAQVTFHSPGGAPLGVEVTAAAEQGAPVTFGPGHDVHFDIAVRNQPGGARAASVTFVLTTPGGEIPGEQEASGNLQVDAGSRVGPVQAG